MLLNEHTALVTSHILLVPYSEHHVPTYHTWMQDEELQTLTASEPLSLHEEYAMQRSWRRDKDKLTFIACLPPASTITSSPSTIIQAEQDDAPDLMIGDINLFLTPSDPSSSSSDSDSDNNNKPHSQSQSTNQEPQTESVIGEIELMIATPRYRRKGHGRAALRAFLWYISTHLPQILSEYSSAAEAEHDAESVSSTMARNGKGRKAEGKVGLEYLRVKINQENKASIALFESVGFKTTGEGANYFGEVELRMLLSAAQHTHDAGKEESERPVVAEYRLTE